MFAKVIVGLNRPEMDQCFDYAIPEGMELQMGVRVIVPFGGKNARTEGYVIALSDTTEVPVQKMKAVLEVLDDGIPSFTPMLLQLAEWMCQRYFCTLNQCLQAMLPAGIRTKSHWIVQKTEPAQMTALTAKEEAVLDLFAQREEISLDELKEEIQGNLSVVLKNLQEKGYIIQKQVLHRREYRREKKLYTLHTEHPDLKAVWKKAETDKRLEGQKKLLLYLADGKEATAEELKNTLEITDSPIKTLLTKGILRERRQAELRSVCEATEQTVPFQPTAEQAAALAALRAELKEPKKRPVLLHGVTGSGKTEIYMQLIADVVAKGKQAIVLVPEIALTPLILERFLSRFGEAVSITHSRLSMGERVDQWKKARDGQISVIIGPRSALFMPFQNVGVIIMDEAHENSYVSDSTPKYDTKDVAQAAAKAYGALLVMGTATPDLVSYHKAQTGEYLLLELKQRAGGGILPETQIVDLRRELNEGNRSPFSRQLQKAIRETLEKKEQVMLFLNRRGSATFVSCRSCGEAMKCPECNITYTYHTNGNSLVCHYCGRRVSVPKLCPACGSKYIRYFGTGTQKIEEEAKRLFLDARILRMDLDTTMKKHSHEAILEAFGNGQADILIGTQMIAKGHDFPKVTLVGIMAADTSLHTDSYTASETAFRLMTQVAGRAGRSQLGGKAIIQTYQPEHYAVRYAAAQDYQGFAAEELLLREMMGYPPFASFFHILLTGEKEETVKTAAAELAEMLQNEDTEKSMLVLGPIPAALAKFRGEYRYQLTVQSMDEENLRDHVLSAVEKWKKKRWQGIYLQIALNPTNVV